MSFRYILDGLSEEQLMEVDRTERVGNVSVSTWSRRGGELALDAFGDTSIVDAADAATTAEPSVHEEAGQDD
jgi:hypothetical protein